MFCCSGQRVGLATLVDMDQELLALQRHVVAARVDSLRQSSTAAMDASQDRELRSAEERGVTSVQDIRARLKKKHRAQRAALEQQIRDADARLSHFLLAPPGAGTDGRPDVDAQAGVELLEVVLSQHQQKVRGPGRSMQRHGLCLCSLTTALLCR